MSDKWSEIFDRVTPLFLIVLAAGLIYTAQVKNFSDLKSYAIGVGGAGLGLLTQQVKSKLTSHTEKGGTTNIVTPPPAATDLPATS